MPFNCTTFVNSMIKFTFYYIYNLPVLCHSKASFFVPATAKACTNWWLHSVNKLTCIKAKFTAKEAASLILNFLKKVWNRKLKNFTKGKDQKYLLLMNFLIVWNCSFVWKWARWEWRPPCFWHSLSAWTKFIAVGRTMKHAPSIAVYPMGQSEINPFSSILN